MERVESIIEVISLAMEAAGVGVMVLGAALTTAAYLVRLRTVGADKAYVAYRRELARSILLGLEFLVAGDIVRTVVVAPNLENVALLAGIVLIRTFLSFTLELEVTGRFPWHDGHFDPGQRVANLAMLVAFLAVTASGIAMALLHGGPAFVWLVPVHRVSTYVLIPLIAGHILIASGVLPGYRGVWRAMHLGGRLDASVARRLWPGWADREERRP